MPKRNLLYVPLVLLFLFSGWALVAHYANIPAVFARATRAAKLPFGLSNGRIFAVSPDAQVVGVRVGDRLVAINGRSLSEDDAVYNEELDALRAGQPITLSLSRAAGEGREIIDAVVVPVEVRKDISYYLGLTVNFLFSYVLPTICILLGFWVLFVRPFDPLAWILLFVLLGLSSLSFEMYWQRDTITGAFQMIFFSCWALAMLLFGIYFPERWSLDEKLPWLKWFLIIPLAFQILLTFLSLLRVATGFNAFDYIGPVANFYGRIGWAVNMLSIGLFFAALGHKSGTTTSPDARRRLRVMLYGTSLAVTTSFLIVLYLIFTGAQGSIYDVVPFWI